jgi:hypothetical protein
MNKHTPGPWKHEEWCDDEFAVFDKDGISICNIHDNNRGDSESNARLIAAAPDMLEALIMCYKNTERYQCRNCDETCAEYTDCDLIVLKNIIEAATGQSINEITAATGREG